MKRKGGSSREGLGGGEENGKGTRKEGRNDNNRKKFIHQYQLSIPAPGSERSEIPRHVLIILLKSKLIHNCIPIGTE